MLLQGMEVEPIEEIAEELEYPCVSNTAVRKSVPKGCCFFCGKRRRRFASSGGQRPTPRQPIPHDLQILDSIIRRERVVVKLRVLFPARGRL